MALVLADRVRDTTTTTGTGTVTLSGTAPTGYQNFSAIGNGNTTYYTINGGSEWGVGIGTYSSTGPTLARTTVLASSNSGSLVNFSAGTKDVFVTYPAEKSVNYDASNNVGIGNVSPGYRLDVAAADTTAGLGYGVRIRANSTAAAGGLQFTDSGVTAQWGYLAATATSVTLDATDSSTLVFRTGNTERMRVTSGGDVGIGDTAPAYKLTVAGDMRLTGGGDVRLGSATGTTTAGGDSMIYNDANNMIFTTGTTTAERMRIDSSGLVGVGTSSPSTYNGLLNAKASDRAVIGYFGGTTYATRLGANSSYATIEAVDAATGVSSYQPLQIGGSLLKFDTGGSERMRISSGGNVGIGTTNPTSLLDVNGNAEVNGTLFLGSSNHGNLASDSNTLYARGTNIAFQNAAGSGTYAYIDSSGNFSIGNTFGSARLRVVSGANVNAPTLGSVTNYPVFLSNTDASYGLGIGTNASDGHTWLQGQRADGNAGGIYNITLNEAGGNVGIGISSPVDKLNVSDGTATFQFKPLGGSSIGFMGMRTNHALGFTTNDTERMRIGSNGGIAIGGSGTDASLHIQQAYGGYNRLTQMAPSGTSNNAFNLMAAKNSGGSDNWWSWGVRTDAVWCLVPGVDSALTSSTGIYFDSSAQAYKPGGGSWQATSDARVKTNIAPITDAANRIMALKPSSFDYRAPEAHAGRTSDRGFIAQEFEEVYPHSVSSIGLMCDEEKVFFAEGEEMKTLGLNNDFFADLVALVQEQQETINDLRARVAQLEGN